MFCPNILFFFFQAEDGIRDKLVTGVQTCALPISTGGRPSRPDPPVTRAEPMGPDGELPVTTVPGETAAVESDTTTAADLTSAPEAAAEVRELVAQSLSQYLRAWWL